MARDLPYCGDMSGLNKLGLVLRRVVPAVVLAGSLGACVVRGNAHARLFVPIPIVVIDAPPPPPPRQTIVIRPGHIWIEGRYHHNNGRYVWHDGYYERERSGHAYRPGRWQRQGNGHVWVDGRWEAHGNGRGHQRDRAKTRDHR